MRSIVGQVMRAAGAILLMVAFVGVQTPPIPQAQAAGDQWEYVGSLTDGHTNGEGIAVSPTDSTLVAVAQKGRIKLVRLEGNKGKDEKYLPDPAGSETYIYLQDLEFSPSGNLLYAWENQGAGRVHVWDVSLSSPQYKGSYGKGLGGSGMKFAVVPTSDADRFVSTPPDSGAGATHQVVIAHAGDNSKPTGFFIEERSLGNEKVAEVRGGNRVSTRAVDYAPNGKFYVVGTIPEDIFIVTPTKGGRIVHKIGRFRRANADVVAVDPYFSTYVAAGSSRGNLAVWKVSTSRTSPVTFQGHKDMIHDIDWFATGTSFVTASSDKTVKIWELGKKYPSQTLKHEISVGAVAVADGGRALLTDGNNEVKIWRKKSKTSTDEQPVSYEEPTYDTAYYDDETHTEEPDEDLDGLTDSEEINIYFTDPYNPDTDNDGLIDGDEVYYYYTDPLNPDDGAIDATTIEEPSPSPSPSPTPTPTPEPTPDYWYV